MPTLHIVTTDDGKKHKQFMTTYWCKLKEVGKVQQRKSVNQVVVAGGSFETMTTMMIAGGMMVLPRLATRVV